MEADKTSPLSLPSSSQPLPPSSQPLQPHRHHHHIVATTTIITTATTTANRHHHLQSANVLENVKQILFDIIFIFKSLLSYEKGCRYCMHYINRRALKC